MPESKKTSCALCNTIAQFEHHDNGQTRYYECPECRNYAITETAIRYLNKHPSYKPKLVKCVYDMANDIDIVRIRRSGNNPGNQYKLCPQVQGLYLEVVSRTKYSQ